MNEEAEEAFEDAVELQTPALRMDLETAIEEARTALNLFLNNHFELAKAKMEPWSNESMYHALGYATIVFIKAAMTCEEQDIEHAVRVAKKASAVCDKFRRCGSNQNSFAKLVKNFEKAVYTEEEMHAELCYAETLLIRAIVTFFQDENLVTFVKGALKIRSCYQSYRECQRILIDSKSVPNGQTKTHGHYESGVRMGIGAFNLMLSTVPNRVLRLLEFVGFSGDKSYGLDQLYAASADVEFTLRGPLCSMALLAWQLVFTFALSTGEADFDACERLLQPLRRSYPNSSIVLYFAGRFAQVQARMSEAIDYFHQSIDAQCEWRHYHYLCYWELSFCYAFTRQWLKAAECAEKLFLETRWSKSTYAYMAAVFLLADPASEENASAMQRIRKLFEEVPVNQKRIAGKPIPLEKFCTMKVDRFAKKGELVLANYELLYLWNAFAILGKDVELVKPILQGVEFAMQENSEDDFVADDYCLCLLLKAMCLKYLQSPFQAEQCLLKILTYEKQLTDNFYLIPHSLYELSFLKLDDGEIQESKAHLQKAREYKNYSMESRLHFRMHALNDRLGSKTP